MMDWLQSASQYSSDERDRLQAPEVPKALQPLSIEFVGGSVEEFSRYLDGEMRRWASVVQAAGLKQ
jgi:tripartite-type tricarboxylate transporter receptor subunit TctC